MTITVDPGVVFTLGDIALRGDAANLAPAEFGLIPGGAAGSGNGASPVATTAPDEPTDPEAPVDPLDSAHR